MIRHYVHLRFQPSISDAEKEELYKELAGLSTHLEGIVNFQFRKNISVETALVRNFVDMFWFDFVDADARNAYLEDAKHQAIGARIVEKLEGGADGVFVCDIDL